MCDTEEVAIIIPQILKTHLEDDCVEIVKRGKVSNSSKCAYACLLFVAMGGPFHCSF